MILFNHSMESAMFNSMRPISINKKIFTLATAFVFLNGCVHSHHNVPSTEKPDQSLSQHAVCCQSLSQLPFKILPPHLKARLNLDGNDPVVNISGDKTYVEPISLPKTKNGILLQIDSLVSRHHSGLKASAIYPVITLLDSNHQPIETLDELPFEFKGALYGWKKIRIVATIDQRFPDARYALIHTNTEKLSQSLSTRRPVSIIQSSDFDSMLYHQSSFSRKRIDFSSTGVLSVLAYPL